MYIKPWHLKSLVYCWTQVNTYIVLRMICDTLEHGHHNQNNRVNRNSSETMHDLICVVAHTPTHSWLVLSLEAVVEVVELQLGLDVNTKN